MTANAACGGTYGCVARFALTPGAARTGIVLTAALVQARGAWTDALCQAVLFHLLLKSATSALLLIPASCGSASVHAPPQRRTASNVRRTHAFSPLEILKERLYIVTDPPFNQLSRKQRRTTNSHMYSCRTVLLSFRRRSSCRNRADNRGRSVAFTLTALDHGGTRIEEAMAT